MVTQTATCASTITTESDDTKDKTTPAFNDLAHAEKAVAPMDPFYDLVAGYPKLAGRMGAMPEIAMFRRFGALNARNLLYMQNELAVLGKKLKQIEVEDSKSMEGKKRSYCRNAVWLNTANIKFDGQLRDGDAKQRDLVLKMRVLLNQYSESDTIRPHTHGLVTDEHVDNALIQQATILREMKKPDAFDIHDIQCFLASDKMTVINDRNEEASALIGADRDLWGSVDPDERKAYSRELVVLWHRKDMDTFSRVVGAKAIKWIIACGGSRWKKTDVRWGTQAIHDATIFKLTFWFTSSVAAIVPVVSIILLVKMDSLNGRLGIIAAFNVLISICLTLFTEARRTDVFAATAACGSLKPRK
jgi:hypothetical protein